MPTCWSPCPSCGQRGAQLIRFRPLEAEYFCESCLTEFAEPLDPGKANSTQALRKQRTYRVQPSAGGARRRLAGSPS